MRLDGAARSARLDIGARRPSKRGRVPQIGGNVSNSQTPAPTGTLEALQAEISRLQQENAALQVEATASIRFIVSEKGAVCVLGLNSYPVTLYSDQWERFIPHIPRLQRFIAEHRGQLSTKTAKTAKAALDAQRADMVAAAEARAK